MFLKNLDRRQSKNIGKVGKPRNRNLGLLREKERGAGSKEEFKVASVGADDQSAKANNDFPLKELKKEPEEEEKEETLSTPTSTSKSRLGEERV